MLSKMKKKDKPRKSQSDLTQCLIQLTRQLDPELAQCFEQCEKMRRYRSMERPAPGLRPPPRSPTLTRSVSKPCPKARSVPETASIPEMSHISEPKKKPDPTPPSEPATKPTSPPKPLSETLVKPEPKLTPEKKPGSGIFGEPELKPGSDEKPEPPIEPASDQKPYSQSKLMTKVEIELPEFPGIDSQDLIKYFQLFLQKLDPEMTKYHEKCEESIFWENLGPAQKPDPEPISPLEIVVKPITLLQPAHKSIVEPKSETKTIIAPESVSKPNEMETEAEPTAVPVSKPATLLKSKPELKHNNESKTVNGTISKSSTVLKPTPEVKCETKPATISESISKMTPKHTIIPGAVTRPLPSPKPIQKSEPGANSAAKSSHRSESVPRTTTKPKPPLESKAESMPEFKPVPKPESTTSPSFKSEGKPMVKPESAPPSKSATKPDTKPEQVASPSPNSKPKPKPKPQLGPETQPEIELPVIPSTQDFLKQFQLFLQRLDPEIVKGFLKCYGTASDQAPKQTPLTILKTELKLDPKPSPHPKPEVEPYALPNLNNQGILGYFQLLLQKLDLEMSKCSEKFEENTREHGVEPISSSESKPKPEIKTKALSATESKSDPEPLSKSMSKTGPPSKLKLSPKPVSKSQNETKHKPMPSQIPQSATTIASQPETQTKSEIGLPILSASSKKELLKTFQLLLLKVDPELAEYIENYEGEKAISSLKLEPNSTLIPKSEVKPKSKFEPQPEQEAKTTVAPGPKHQELIKYFRLILQKIDSKTAQRIDKAVATEPNETTESLPSSDPKTESSLQSTSSLTPPIPVLPPKQKHEPKPKTRSKMINPPAISDPNNQNLIKCFQRLLHKFDPEIAKCFEKCDETTLSDCQKPPPMTAIKPSMLIVPRSSSQPKREERPQPRPKSKQKLKPHLQQESVLETKRVISTGSDNQDLFKYFQQFLQRFESEMPQCLEKFEGSVGLLSNPGSKPEVEAKSEAKPSVDSNVNNSNVNNIFQQMPMKLYSKVANYMDKCEEPKPVETANIATRLAPIPKPETEPKPEIKPNSESDHQDMMKYFLLFLQRFDPELAQQFYKPPLIIQSTLEAEDKPEQEANQETIPSLNYNTNHKEMIKYFQLFLQKFDPEMAVCFGKCDDTLPSEDSKVGTKSIPIKETLEEPMIVLNSLPDPKPTPLPNPKSSEDQGISSENLVKYFQLVPQTFDPVSNFTSYDNQELLKSFQIFLQKVEPEMSQCFKTCETLETIGENSGLEPSPEPNYGQVTKPVDAVNVLRL
ncbi:hypothetical protein Aperf_G00000064326 [Anoplocephala perfoliata]